MSNHFVTFAQNREDVILASFFDDESKGFYIDVGAHHPVFDSVTKHFYEKGWSGINVEPIKKYHNLLKADRLRDINLNIGLGSKPGSLKLREYISDAGEGLSTFSESMKKSYEDKQHWATGKFEEYDVEVKTLDQICSAYLPKDTKISFLKIDVEGFEYEVLKGFDLSIYRPLVICIESNHIENKWTALLMRQGYDLVLKDGINDYYVDKQQYSDVYDYTEKCLLRFPYITRWTDESEKVYLENKTVLQERILSTTKVVGQDTQQTTLYEYASLRQSVRRFIRDIDSWMILIASNSNSAIRLKFSEQSKLLAGLVHNYNKLQPSNFRWIIARIYFIARRLIKLLVGKWL